MKYTFHFLIIYQSQKNTVTFEMRNERDKEMIEAVKNAP